MFPIIKRERAKADLIELADYIARESMRSSTRFLNAAERMFQAIAENPEIGVARDYLDPRARGLRMLPITSFKKHLIYYRIIRGCIEIVRVLHATRDQSRAIRKNR